MNIDRIKNWKFLAGALLGLASCSQEKAENTRAEAPPEPTPEVLRLYSWSDYFDEEVFEQFEEETGIKVDYVVFEDTDEMVAKLRSEPGHYDVIVADDTMISGVAELKLVRQLKHALLPNLSNIAEEHLNRPFDPGNKHSAPYMWGTTLVAYRSDKISDPEESWSLLWDPELKGKTMVIEERFELISLAKFVAGHPMDSVEPAHFSDATAKLVELIDELDTVFGSDADVREKLDSGEVWAAMCYSGDAAMVAAENEDVSFFIPKEGAPLWMDSFAVVRDSNYPQAAHKLINFMLDAKIAAANTNYTYYASPNKAAHPFIEAEILEDESIYPTAEVREKCDYRTQEDAAGDELLNASWLAVLTKLKEREDVQIDEQTEPTEKTAGINDGEPG